MRLEDIKGKVILSRLGPHTRDDPRYVGKVYSMWGEHLMCIFQAGEMCFLVRLTKFEEASPVVAITSKLLCTYEEIKEEGAPQKEV